VSITIVDYGVGNLASVARALTFVGASPRRVTDPGAVGDSTAIVIPGVGHFSSTRALNALWRKPIIAAVDNGVPILGICLGMQWLFDGSAEDPDVPGLGLMPGVCERLTGSVKIPHVGWNTLERGSRASVLLEGIGAGAASYFTHSYAAPATADATATTTHAQTFASVVERGRVFGVQWHPEKSGGVGLALLSNFSAFARSVSC